VHGFVVSGEGVFVFAYAGCDADDGFVGLELGEGRFEDFPGAFCPVGCDEVCRHVVGGPE